MSNKTHEEKLRILQERLKQIKEKSVQEAELEEPKIPASEVELPKKKKVSTTPKWLKYTVICIITIYGVMYLYNNISFKLTVEEPETKEIDIIERTAKIDTPENIEYNLDLTGDNIVVLGTFKDEELAKNMTADLKQKGFKSDYFYLPSKSNSSKELYKVFIGPYENKAETNQWVKNIEIDFEILTLKEDSSTTKSLD